MTFIPPKLAAQMLSVSTRTLYDWRQKRIGPPWYSRNGLLRYDQEEVVAWLREYRRETTQPVEGGR